MSEIKIAVACHKPSVLPKNNLFVPVQVGAFHAKKKIDGMRQDNEGENISEKNPNYCELTAQYWLWKNIEADYYGLCHYRRFLAFKDPGVKRNLRNQIDATIPDQYNFERFGLEDEILMKKEIESADLVIGDTQSVPQLYTPRGVQSSAYQHWVKHDRALIMKKDLDTMLSILNQVSPKIGRAAKEYLSGKNFLGFNCFIAKKELFNELCEIEFKTLELLEKKIDFTNYNQQLTRIYGFMAEIISSSYFYYIEKSGKYTVKHVPLVYFKYTDPIDLNNKNTFIPIIFDHADNNPILFAPIWRSFLDWAKPTSKYNVFLIADLTKELEKEYHEMVPPGHNVKLTCINAEMLREIINERLSDKITRKNNKSNNTKRLFDEQIKTPILPILPTIFNQIDHAIVLNENIIISNNLDELWEKHGKTEKMIAAAKNVNIISKVNDIYPETLEIYLKKKINNPYNYFSISSFVWNMAKFREKYQLEELKNTYLSFDNEEKTCIKEEIMNILCQDDIEWINQKWSVWYDSNQVLAKQLPYLPATLYKELLSAQSDPSIICYEKNDPFGFEFNKIYSEFWKYARKTTAYENIQMFQMKFAIKNQNVKPPVISKLLPIDGRARGKITKILPPGSRRNRAAKKMLSKIGLR